VNREFLAQGDKLNKLLRIRHEDMVGLPAAQFASTLAGFPETRPEHFDLGVLTPKLGATGSVIASAQLTGDDLAAVSTPEIQRLSKALQYSVNATLSGHT
jgi:hypothetical protein